MLKLVNYVAPALVHEQRSCWPPGKSDKKQCGPILYALAEILRPLGSNSKEATEPPTLVYQQRPCQWPGRNSKDAMCPPFPMCWQRLYSQREATGKPCALPVCQQRPFDQGEVTEKAYHFPLCSQRPCQLGRSGKETAQSPCVLAEAAY